MRVGDRRSHSDSYVQSGPSTGACGETVTELGICGLHRLGRRAIEQQRGLFSDRFWWEKWRDF